MSTDCIGFWTLLRREFLRFFKVPNNTIVPQMVTVLFYFLIFGVAIGSRIETIGGVPYLLFILPGLFVQNLINGSYSNASGSLFVSRIVGNSMQDVLLSPISYVQFTLAYVIASMLRGAFLAVGTVAVFLLFMRFSIAHWGIFLAYSLLTAFACSCCGIIIGLWSKNWDQLNI
ncbi:MAG: ABC transporter permease, partial [Nanoarchaeota archaeon]